MLLFIYLQKSFCHIFVTGHVCLSGSPSLSPSLLPPFCGRLSCLESKAEAQDILHFTSCSLLGSCSKNSCMITFPQHIWTLRYFFFFFFFAIRSPFEILDWILAARMPHSYLPAPNHLSAYSNWGSRAAAARFQRRWCGCMQACQNRSITDMQSSFRNEALHGKCGCSADAAASAGGSCNIWLSSCSNPSKHHVTPFLYVHTLFFVA